MSSDPDPVRVITALINVHTKRGRVLIIVPKDKADMFKDQGVPNALSISCDIREVLEP